MSWNNGLNLRTDLKVNMWRWAVIHKSLLRVALTKPFSSCSADSQSTDGNMVGGVSYSGCTRRFIAGIMVDEFDL